LRCPLRTPLGRELYSKEDWTKAYAADREPESKDRLTIFFRCAAHAYHHVGQIIYLLKELTAGR